MCSSYFHTDIVSLVHVILAVYVFLAAKSVYSPNIKAQCNGKNGQMCSGPFPNKIACPGGYWQGVLKCICGQCSGWLVFFISIWMSINENHDLMQLRPPVKLSPQHLQRIIASGVIYVWLFEPSFVHRSFLLLILGPRPPGRMAAFQNTRPRPIFSRLYLSYLNSTRCFWLYRIRVGLTEWWQFTGPIFEWFREVAAE